ncbi:DUF2280 domain-containing protein [Pseudomonas syringae]|uniref:DUF2280 domain-containing protein n=1 Tax=Pseudomonas syringae TaxID=317 RepID=A0A6B2B4R0_PSESX|nr:DUF2280 domain-containing protein [Pseudomonas syringae]MBI6561559.1 DUF2280 domain-containing protein [Pseudomonas syringae]MBI6573043.1 DUF2280 domain-containing protein [Pseudomonas syringae]MBI6585436.1 DUF2280 domain-containing protein [Pseudomonas syringae]MBI6593788.1 DUF2280 domain-containing protein [Pseudomonas syringae]NAO34385.1 DUF2280 domain-containing protein [Pseudomonas syringae]
MATLSPEIKTFTARALACFDSPSQVAEVVKVNFGVTVSRQQVDIRAPTKRSSKGLAKRWVTLFEDTRASFRETMVEVPVANRAYRLHALGRMLEEAERRDILKLLEQAAKECGDIYNSAQVKQMTGQANSPHRCGEFVLAPLGAPRQQVGTGRLVPLVISPHPALQAGRPICATISYAAISWRCSRKNKLS